MNLPAAVASWEQIKNINSFPNRTRVRRGAN